MAPVLWLQNFGKMEIFVKNRNLRQKSKFGFYCGLRLLGGKILESKFGPKFLL